MEFSRSDDSMQPPGDGGVGGGVDLLRPHGAHGARLLPRPTAVVRRVADLYVRLVWTPGSIRYRIAWTSCRCKYKRTSGKWHVADSLALIIIVLVPNFSADAVHVHLESIGAVAPHWRIVGEGEQGVTFLRESHISRARDVRPRQHRAHEQQ